MVFRTGGAGKETDTEISVINTARLVNGLAIKTAKNEKIEDNELAKTTNQVEEMKKKGLGGQIINETMKMAKKAGIDETYAMQALILTGFTIDEIRKYGEPVAKNADFSLRNIMETKSSAQMMVEQQILGMVAVKKFEEDEREKKRYTKFGSREEDT